MILGWWAPWPSRRQRPVIRHETAVIALDALAGVVALAAAGLVTTVGTGRAAAAGTDWTVYHGNPAGSGVDASGDSFSPASHLWTSATLDGQLFGEPLEATGRVFVATENDTVYALAANTWPCCGRRSWARRCRPVIDTARSEIFAVADELVDGAPSHHLVGLNIFTGAVELNQAVDPPGSDTAALLQRTGLNLDQGNVVFGFGGNAGDCSSYHGWVESVPEGGGSVQRYEVDAAADESQGADRRAG